MVLGGLVRGSLRWWALDREEEAKKLRFWYGSGGGVSWNCDTRILVVVEEMMENRRRREGKQSNEDEEEAAAAAMVNR